MSILQLLVDAAPLSTYSCAPFTLPNVIGIWIAQTGDTPITFDDLRRPSLQVRNAIAEVSVFYTDIKLFVADVIVYLAKTIFVVPPPQILRRTGNCECGVPDGSGFA